MRPPKAPRRRVVRAGGLVGGVKIADAEVQPVKPDLDGEAAGAARADAAVSPSFPATGGMVARRRRGKKERAESGGKAQSRERAMARHRAVGGRWIL